jgi:VWFA-related protein
MSDSNFHQNLRRWPRPEFFLRVMMGLSVLLTAICATAEGQTPPTADLTIDEIIRLDSSLVVLDVQALNRKTGAIVNGLKPGDFELFEDGVRQEITHFSQDKLALSVVLLMDLSGSVSPVLKEIQSGALLALDRLKDSDEVAVIACSSETFVVQGFTRDRRLIVEKIGSIEKTPVIGQGTSLYEGMAKAATHMRNAGNPTSRRVIIVITDNIAWEYHFAGMTEKELSDQIFESGSMVCGLVVEGAMTSTEKIFTRNRSGEDLYRRKMSVDPFANQTGGEIIRASKTEVNSRLALLIDHLRTRYSLGFTPSREKTDGAFHRITLSLSPETRKRMGDVVIRTRQGYYARRLKE